MLAAIPSGVILLSNPRHQTRLAAITTCFLVASAAYAQAHIQQDTLPDAPASQLALTPQIAANDPAPFRFSSSVNNPFNAYTDPQQQTGAQSQTTQQQGSDTTKQPLKQQKRVFGVLANYTSVSGGTKPKPAGWKTDSEVAWKQSTDYTAIGFSVITSAIAYGEDSHPLLDTVNGGNAPFWAYTWRGFADKSDQTLQGSLFFPALLHQDTRYYAVGTGSKWKRALHAVDSVVVARSYSGNPVFNVAGLAGKAGTQAVSKTYYPAGSEGFGVLVEKFTYACLRQAGFTVLKEFSPDLSQHLHLHIKGSD